MKKVADDYARLLIWEARLREIYESKTAPEVHISAIRGLIECLRLRAAWRAAGYGKDDLEEGE